MEGVGQKIAAKIDEFLSTGLYTGNTYCFPSPYNFELWFHVPKIVQASWPNWKRSKPTRQQTPYKSNPLRTWIRCFPQAGFRLFPCCRPVHCRIAAIVGFGPAAARRYVEQVWQEEKCRRGLRRGKGPYCLLHFWPPSRASLQSNSWPNSRD